MKTLYNIRPFFLMILLGLAACGDTENEMKPSDSFVRIYDDSSFEASYDPIDMVQATNGNYLVLARRRTETSDFASAYFMLIDETGKFIAENDFQNEMVHPLDDILEIGGRFYIISMNASNLSTQLIEITPDGEVGPAIPLGGTLYPLHASVDNQQIILQSYNAVDKRTVVTLLNAQGSLLKQKNFDIGPGSETEAPIIRHFTGSTDKLPFSSGRAGNGLYYFNGFYNYTFSLVFTDLNADNPQGVVQGQHDDGGVSAIMPLNGENFAMSAFNFGSNYLMPRAVLNTSGISSVVDIVDNPFPELIPNARISIAEANNGSANVTLMGSSTKNGQIIISGFQGGSGNLIGTKYLGYGNENKLASIIQTADGGMAVLGTTTVAGRFERIVIYKLSENESSSVLTMNTLNTSS